MAYNGLKMGTFHLFGHSKRSEILFFFFSKKCIFDPFLVPKQPIVGGPKQATTDSKCAKKNLFWHPTWSWIIFEKESFFFCTQWTLLTRFGTHLFGLLLAACRTPMGPGLGSRLPFRPF